MPLSIQYAKPLSLPTYDPAKAKALLASTGLSKQQLTLDFYYPSNVSRPYMPDPKGLFQAITADLEAAGFTINPHTDVWSPTYLDSGYAGKYPLSRFLYIYVNRKPGAPLDPLRQEFLKYVLSREGQIVAKQKSDAQLRVTRIGR